MPRGRRASGRGDTASTDNHDNKSPSHSQQAPSTQPSSSLAAPTSQPSSSLATPTSQAAETKVPYESWTHEESGHVQDTDMTNTGDILATQDNMANQTEGATVETTNTSTSCMTTSEGLDSSFTSHNQNANIETDITVDDVEINKQTPDGEACAESYSEAENHSFEDMPSTDKCDLGSSKVGCEHFDHSLIDNVHDQGKNDKEQDSASYLTKEKIESSEQNAKGLSVPSEIPESETLIKDRDLSEREDIADTYFDGRKIAVDHACLKQVSNDAIPDTGNDLEPENNDNLDRENTHHDCSNIDDKQASETDREMADISEVKSATSNSQITKTIEIEDVEDETKGGPDSSKVIVETDCGPLKKHGDNSTGTETEISDTDMILSENDRDIEQVESEPMEDIVKSEGESREVKKAEIESHAVKPEITNNSKVSKDVVKDAKGSEVSEDVEEDSWDAMFDEDGECLNPDALEEVWYINALTKSIARNYNISQVPHNFGFTYI